MKIVKLSSSHLQQWQELYSAYAQFYKTPMSTETLNTVWQWLSDNKLRGLGAVNDDQTLIGIAHWAPLLRPLRGAPMGYLHDLFVLPQSRGAGVGAKLIEVVAQDARKDGCDLLRWATAYDNHTAMRLYDHIAVKTKWVIYEQNTN